MGKTTDLRRELKKRFYPFAISQGFQVDTTHSPFNVDFRRVMAEGIDVFGLQWEKYGKPRFVVNFGHCSASGVIHHGERVPPDKVLPYMGSSSGRLQPRKGSGTHCWFSQDRSFFRRVVLQQKPRSAACVVDELLDLFPELQEWFRHRRMGPHMIMAPSRQK
ncbi:hypothetical protein [Pseudoduganella albidiflava]|uniref:DUF4304 domain-containing protein n=1 Tax=Pseudoduganella albidiflava TaxID=321983 RepID=A0A411WSC5_9BURK|nr:hypothetical protein [Pseudoduganella albidiflava]QBH99547.1 hypothetical protein EYF70_00840 [Pseudoduganella albidiflava]GGY45684.1 hypothetical protein GCM10007387_29700 [Pseudoduganella albidiflava]